MAPLSGDNGKDTTKPLGQGSRAFNSSNHGEVGQLVVFGDTHAELEHDPYVGVNGDNIFTAGNLGTQHGITALGVIPPAGTNDTIMVPVRRTSDGSMGP
jgi:hypothetical protein